MEAYFSLKPLIVVLVPLLAAVFIMLSGRRPNIRELWTILGSVAMFGVVFSMLPDVLGSKYPEIVLFAISPGISLALRADTAGIIFGLSASALWIVTSIFSIGYMRSLFEKKQTRYYACFAVCLSSAMGIAFAANLLTFVIFYEMLTIATYPLVIHKESPEAIQAGRKYLAYLLTGGVVLIIATALTYKYTGALDFSPGGFLNGVAGQYNLLPLFVLFLIGLGMKAALIPLHSWLPTAMIAPTPVSALLHAVAVVKAGVFGFVRVIGFVFGPTLFHEIGAGSVLAIMASITIVVSSLLAMYQHNLKRRLAYSTVVHLGYILLGIALLSPGAWVGGLVHIANHAAMKITLFFCAGAIYVKTHCENIDDLDGIGKQMPITMGAFALVSIGLVGMPPVNGFISKWFLGQGTLAVEQGIYLVILLLSGLLNAGYLFPIVWRAFFVQSRKHVKFAEASALLLAPLVLTALGSLFLGLVPNGIFHFYSLASNVATSVLAGVGR
ncbi:MAG: monovalent cation/H+ antiporter subunit D family protein [Chloroflexi bacterium]|nr:monovalent cation/H+ antiporter subunit D family protein [Chloroflexota bacterium]